MKHRKDSDCEKHGVGESARDETFRPRRRGETRLEIPSGKPDLKALRSVTREWLVPLLVEKFLRDRGIELRAQLHASSRKAPISNA